MFVLDASVALAHTLGEPEFAAEASRIVGALEHEVAVVPPIWWLELSAVLLKRERGQRLT